MRVLEVRLPGVWDVLERWRGIDRRGVYSNGGPLVRELEGRLGGVVVANGTIGLELAYRVVFPVGAEVVVPAFTFPATVTALVRAGMVVRFADVDAGSWCFTPGMAREVMGRWPYLEHFAPVCAFGVANPGWDGISAVVDAAGAYGNHSGGVSVYSLHATKPLGCGEGGLVTGPADVLARVARLSNFGVDGGVVIEVGTNGRMSEYHAAVALAALETWEARRAHLASLERAYRERLDGRFRMQERSEGAYQIFPVLVGDAVAVGEKLAGRGIETRRWYVPGLDRHPAFKVECDLPVTRMLERELLCLPFHWKMDEGDVETVCRALLN